MPLGPLITIYILIIGLCCLALACVYYLYVHAIIFSRITISLFIGWVLTQNCPRLAEAGLINFALYALIAMAVVFGMSLFLRMNLAIRFTSTVLVSLVLTMIFATITCSILSVERVPLGVEVVIRVLCVFGPLFSVLDAASESSEFFADGAGKVLTHVDRAIASAFYALTIFCVSYSFVDNWVWPAFVHYAIGIAVAVLMFIADYRYSIAADDKRVRQNLERLRAAAEEEEKLREFEEDMRNS